jgi:hypothetical protein
MAMVFQQIKGKTTVTLVVLIRQVGPIDGFVYE